MQNSDGESVEPGDTLKSIKDKLSAKNIYLSEETINNKPTIIGYEKRFKLKWMATQLNTFIVAADFGDNNVTEQTIEDFFARAFKYAKKNYRGWPRGLQSGLAVIGILISKNIDQSAISYCQKLKAGKKYSGFAIPVTIDPSTNQVYYFNKKPIWGKIYYPHFEKMINDLT
ncbi:MAG: hypothetical protein K9M80_04880 [Candidatus Marinimicrobia bacterium]|nr:hypothetical protein [Candidatus Neomarinimicrobiota bacterium]